MRRHIGMTTGLVAAFAVSVTACGSADSDPTVDVAGGSATPAPSPPAPSSSAPSSSAPSSSAPSTSTGLATTTADTTPPSNADYPDAPRSTLSLPDGSEQELIAADITEAADVEIDVRVATEERIDVTNHRSSAILIPAIDRPDPRSPAIGIRGVDLPFERGDIDYGELPTVPVTLIAAGDSLTFDLSNPDSMDEVAVCLEIIDGEEPLGVGQPEPTETGEIAQSPQRYSEATLEVVCAAG